MSARRPAAPPHDPARRHWLTAAAALPVAGLLPPLAQAQGGPLRVVASFSILGDLVRQVGGEFVEVTTLVGPNGDAHHIEPTPQHARAVKEARVLVRNGLNFEGWLPRLMRSAAFGGLDVVASDGITPRRLTATDVGDTDAPAAHDKAGHEHAGAHDHDHGHGHDHDHGRAHDERPPRDEGHRHDHGSHQPPATGRKSAHDSGHDHDHGHDHGHSHGAADHAHDHVPATHASAAHDGHDHAHQAGDIDPHAWQNVAHTIHYVRNIAQALAQADPARRVQYEQRAAQYESRLRALDAELRTAFTALPTQQRRVITSHEAFGYFGDAYGLQFLTVMGHASTAEPSARTMADLIRRIRASHASALFIENMTNPRVIEQIARETGIPSGGLLYADALAEPGHPADTYLGMMRTNAATLLAALKR